MTAAKAVAFRLFGQGRPLPSARTLAESGEFLKVRQRYLTAQSAPSSYRKQKRNNGDDDYVGIPQMTCQSDMPGLLVIRAFRYCQTTGHAVRRQLLTERPIRAGGLVER